MKSKTGFLDRKCPICGNTLIAEEYEPVVYVFLVCEECRCIMGGYNVRTAKERRQFKEKRGKFKSMQKVILK